MLSFSLGDDVGSFDIFNDNSSLSLSVVGAVSSAENNGVMMFQLANGTAIQIFSDTKGIIQTLISTDGTFPIDVNFQSSQKATAINGNVLIGPFVISAIDANASINDNGFRVASSMQFARLEIIHSPESDVSQMSAMTLRAMSAYEFDSSAEAKTEFTIAIFDDADMTRVRPIKNGAFVVSTVPSLHGDEDLSETDQTYYDLGVGPETRTLYFKVCASHYAEANPPVTPVAPKLKLLMPNGIDTLTDPIDIPLIQEDFTASGSTWVMPTWLGSYVFHTEDTVNYVDGIGYIYAYFDTSFVMSAEMHLDVVADGDSVEDFGPEELNLSFGDSTQF